MRGGQQKIQTGRLWLPGRLLTDTLTPRRVDREQAEWGGDQVTGMKTRWSGGQKRL